MVALFHIYGTLGNRTFNRRTGQTDDGPQRRAHPRPGQSACPQGDGHRSMRIVGPAIGGLLIATLGFNWNFFIEGGFT